jgi:hippurate hydrolase
MTAHSISNFAHELVAIRHDFHMHPELAFQEHRTAKIVAQELASVGVSVETGVAKTGVVGTISNGTSRKVIAIRADMDALPIQETTDLEYASLTAGKMHACGHDGHTTMLLGLARHLASTRNFDGTVHLIFQPAEEDISGAKLMVEEGLFKRLKADHIFACHNIPGVAVGQIKVRTGAITAAVEIVDVTIRGVGGHGAIPHLAVDPIVAASSVIMALQTAVSRNTDPLEAAVVTVGSIHGGVIATIIPDKVELKIGVRTVSKATHALMAKRVPEIIKQQAASFGCIAEVGYGEGISYPPCFNDITAAALVRETALSLGHSPESIEMAGPYMFSEDFSFMMEQVSGCFFGMGNGPSKSLHDSGYNFNDELLVKGTAFWAALVERVLKP